MRESETSEVSPFFSIVRSALECLCGTHVASECLCFILFCFLSSNFGLLLFFSSLLRFFSVFFFCLSFPVRLGVWVHAVAFPAARVASIDAAGLMRGTVSLTNATYRARSAGGVRS